MKLLDGVPLEVRLSWRADGADAGANDGADDGCVVGRLAWRDHRAWFEYDADFAQRGLAPSPFHLPVRAGVHAGEPSLGGLHGVFHDSLPDAWGQLLIDRWALASGVQPSTLTPLDRLAIVGTRGMGALTYRPAHPVALSDEALDLDALHRQSTKLLEGSAQEVLPTLLAAGGSPGGARPKVLVAWRPADGRIVHGVDATPTGYQPLLVKFRAPGDPVDMGPIELAYTRMARTAGVVMMPCRLLPAGDGPGYFATDRFDRSQPDGAERVHLHSLAGLLHADHRLPSLDYDALLRVARQLTRDHRQVKQAFRLMVFNVLAHNRDDHAKQFSFVMDRAGVWRLAPAYDLTFSEGPGGEHSTSVNGEGRAPGRSHLLALATSAGLADAGDVVEEVATAVAGWRRFATEAGVGRGSMTRIARRLGG